jgi:hypothetical protein
MLKKPIKGGLIMEKNNTCESSHREPRKKWDHPNLVVYGDMTALTQGGCRPGQVCKTKVLGMGDDFSNNISSLD